MSAISDPNGVPARDWWRRRRLRYNLALIAAGVLAFACFMLLSWWGDSVFPPTYGVETSVLVALRWWAPLAAAALAIFLLVANVCYSAGALVERIIPASYVDGYRRLAFRLGLGLSMLVPFVVPAALAGFLLLSSMMGYGKSVRESNLPGTYVADYGVATDTITLSRDGAFIQTVKVRGTGQEVVARGRWHFNSDPRDQYIWSEEMMDVVDYEGKVNPHFDRPRKNAVVMFNVRWLCGRLEIGGDDIPWGRVGIDVPHTKQTGK
jgi:hypothetical protein